MFTKLAIAASLVATLVGIARPAFAEDVPAYPGAPVAVVQSPDGRPCTFFQLKGVNQASSQKNSPWFSVNRSLPGYKETVSMLMMALASGKWVMATVNGVDAQCGEAQVARIFVQ
jgi:hypothetical protein